MAKMMCWVGWFPTKKDFNDFAEQGTYLQDEYDTPTSAPSFYNELNGGDFDLDFSILKYLDKSDDLEEFAKFVPIKTNLFLSECQAKGLTKANSLICYKRRAGITEEQASSVSSVAYIGIHEYSTREIESRFSTAGMEFSTFVGTTDKSKEEFMKYFDQSEYMQELQDYQAGRSKKKPNPELRCQFCKDVGLDFYYPELLNIAFSDKLIPVNAEILSRKVILEPMLHYNLPRRLQEKGIEKANCAFCYVANGFRNRLLDKHIYIYMKNTPELIKRKKKDIDELDNYNGLFFLGSIIWEE